MNESELGEKTIEINSLSMQGIKPLEMVPPKATEQMLENTKKVLSILHEQYGNQIDCGVSLHLGEVIDIEEVAKSQIPVASIDTPDTAYPTEFIKVALERPMQLVNHVAWRLNSSLGLTKGQATRNLDRKIGLVEENKIEPFTTNPFIRISAKLDENKNPDKKILLDLASKFPNALLAIEYNAEEMSVDEYATMIKQLRQSGAKNIGFSMDLAHVYEYFKIIEQRDIQSAREATINFWERVQKNNSDSTGIFSLDINNVYKNVKGFGETHKGILQQSEDTAIPLVDIVTSYERYLRDSKLDGRIAIEPSPRDSHLLLAGDSAYLFSQIKPFVVSSTSY